MRALAVLIFAVFTLSACKSTPEYLNTQTLASKYKTVGYVNFYVPSELNYFENKLSTFYKPRITRELESAGFRVVDASALYTRFEQLQEETPSLYNTNTGQINEELNNELFAKAMQDVKEELNLDAFLFTGVDVTKAYFSNNLLLGHNANWYGQSEVFLEDGVDAGSVLGSLFLEKTGHLPGSYVYLRFRDTENIIISFAGGGIELLGRFDDDGNVKMKKADYLFDDDSQLSQALQITLSELATHNQ